MKTGHPWKALSRFSAKWGKWFILRETISTKSGCLAQGGVLGQQKVASQAVPSPAPSWSGDPGDPVLVPNHCLVACDIDPMHFCSASPHGGSTPFLALPLPLPGGGGWGAHVEFPTPCDQPPVVAAPSPPRKESRKSLSTPYLH